MKMKRRDFNRIALGMGLSPLLASSALAQATAQTKGAPPTPPQNFNIVIKNTPRTYNQINVPRKYVAGKRRFSIYWTWSYPWESNRDVTELDNRFSTITEVRRVAWPSYETPEFSERMFLQGIAGTLELFHLSTIRFQSLAEEVTGHPVAVYQRIDQAGQKLPIDDRILADTDTMMVFGLDHMVTEQEASGEEIEAIRKFLTREGSCLLLAPHHDVGVSADMDQRQMEYAHHGDPLVPRQQRFGKYTRSLMKGLGVPVENRFGLRPAVLPGTNQLAPLTAMRDLDLPGWLNGVTTFNFHQHLPHYEVTTPDTKSIRVLARQPIDMSKPHPFTRCRQPRIQYVPLDASGGCAGWPYRAGRQHDFHDPVRRIRKPRSVLVQPCDTNLIVIIEVARLHQLGRYQCHKDQPTSTTRRSFLGAATVATAATAATLTASPIAQGEQADEIRVAQTPTEAKPTPPAAPIVKEGDWSKPAAMAIPKGGAFKQEQGRYGLIYPRTPANYGFSILAKVKPGREAAVREYGKTIEKAVADAPDVLAPLKLHYLRWVLFEIKGDTYFMYQGIFDTDFDKYIEDAVALFASTGITTVFTNLEGFPENWQGNVPAMEQVFPGTSMPQLPGVCGIPLCDRR